MRIQRVDLPAKLAGHDAAMAFFAACFAGRGSSRERMMVAHVDDQARCIGLAEYVGDVDHVDLPLRDILGEAIQLGSAGLVLAHNHPSGDPMPSRADCTVTRRLATAGEAMDLTVLDHLVFGRDGSCSSMRRMGYL